jgi:RNA polymerase sigma-70 factor (ECF subfamily)
LPIFWNAAFRVADRQRGKFRSFLLVCLKHFLAHEHENLGPLGAVVGSISSLGRADPRKGLELADSGRNPEQIYDEQWAVRVMDQALSSLRKDFTAAGKSHHFDVFKEYLTSHPPDGTYRPSHRNRNER